MQVFILNFLKRDLKRSQTQIDNSLHSNPNLVSLYKRYKTKLRNIYNQAYYWHGTGLYHYKTLESKYKGVLDFEVEKTLKNIIREGGLKPNDDPWVKTHKEYSRTVSTTPFRIYGRLYAELHTSGNDKLEVTYGNRLLFSKFFIAYTLAVADLKTLIKYLIASFADGRFSKKGPVWAKTINNTLISKGNAISDFIEIVGKAKSNIKGNHGILIGIKKKNFNSATMNKTISLFETRTRDKIPLTSFSHIEVPVKYLNQTEKLLKKYAVSIPVIPIEVGEIYFSKINFSYLP